MICNGRKTILLKLPGVIQSSNLVLYLSCNNCFILRFDKILKSFGRYPTVFKLNCPSAMLFGLAQLLLLNVQQGKQLKKNSTCARKPLKLHKISADIV